MYNRIFIINQKFECEDIRIAIKTDFNPSVLSSNASQQLEKNKITLIMHIMTGFAYLQDKPFTYRVIGTRQTIILAFCFSLKHFWTSSHAGVRYANSNIEGGGGGGLVSTALCVSQSRCTTLPFRFMQIAELGEMHTSVRVGDSRSFVSVKSARVLQAWRFRRTPED